jgi:RNA-binding protein
MKKLTSYQKKYLRGLAHNLKPVVFIGQKGMTDRVANSTDDALNAHELIKVKFNEFKKKIEKIQIAELIETGTGCQLVGIIGHVAIFYRQHSDPEKRKIKVPPTRS